MVKIVFGGNSVVKAYDGQQVAQVRTDLSGFFQIPGNAQVRVNGVTAGEDTTLRPNDVVEFIKQSGEKGC
jgi:hypothetical protein